MSKVPVAGILKHIKQQLQDAGKSNQEAQQNAWWMIEKITHLDEVTLLGQQEIHWPEEHEQQLEKWVNQLIEENKPLQYILGTVPFCDLELFVEPPVLIPRPETEEMVFWLIEQIKQADRQELNIVDVCTGNGCIGLALAANLPKSQVIGLDISQKALDLAEQNKHHLKLSNIEFKRSNGLQALDEGFACDFIISNPPYLSEHSYKRVTDEIRIWEDKGALVAGNDGMAIYAALIDQAPRFLTKQPHPHDNQHLPSLVFEIGKDQELIENMLEKGGFQCIKVHLDLNGLRRWVTACI